MPPTFRSLADDLLARSVTSAGGVPGVVAMATDLSCNVYEGAAGVRELGKDAAMTTDTVVWLASCTKAVTGLAVMQLVEEGRIALGDVAKQYVPAIGKLQVIEGFAADGTPRLRPPKRDITLNDLMLHIAGCSYDFFDAKLARYREYTGIPSVLSATRVALEDALVHDPGERWTYGTNIEWLGLVIEAVCGKRLEVVLRERLYEPLGMKDMAFTMTPSMLARRATMHLRAADGQITAAPDLVLPQNPELDLGGAALYSTVGDFLTLIRMILNDGMGPQGRVLKAETVHALAQNGLGELKSGGWTTTVPMYANNGEFFPGVSKGWSYTFQTIDEDAPTGRRAGSLSWAGLSNVYYWIDRTSGVGGMWATQLLPFMDVASYPGFVEFETLLYRHHR